MADAQLQVVIKARNDAKKAFNELGGQVKGLQGSTGFGGLNDKIGAFGDKFKSLTGVSLGFATAAGAAGGAVKALGKFLADSVNETVAYATEIDNMSRLLGISTEDTSRLVQASDDLFISQEKLQAALQAATRQGIDVSIDGLKRLSEQYLALPPGVERSEFVLKTFGRSGAEMGKLMEVGAEGIEAATAAIADNLVITESSMKSIIAYKQSVDNLSDSWQGVKYSVGQSVIPTLDLLLRSLSKGKDETEKNAQAVNRLNLQLDRAVSAGRAGAKSAELLRKQIAWLTGEYETGEAGVSDFYKGISQMAPEVILAAQAIEDLTNAGATYYSQFKTIAQEEQSYNDNLGEIRSNIRNLMDEKQALLDQGFDMGSAEVQAVTDKIHEQGLAAQGLADEHETATQRIILGFIEQELAMGGLTREESGYLIDLGTKWGIYGEDMKGAYEDAMDSVDNFVRMQNKVIPKQTIELDVIVTGEGAGILMGGVAKAGSKMIEMGKARGGPVSANTPYVVGEVGPELFVPNTSGTIIPNNKLSSGGGASGNTVINFNYAPALSLSDRAEFEGRVIPMMKRLISKAG